MWKPRMKKNRKKIKRDMCSEINVRKKVRKGRINKAPTKQQQVLGQPLPLQGRMKTKRRDCRDSVSQISIWIDFGCTKRRRSE